MINAIVYRCKTLLKAAGSELQGASNGVYIIKEMSTPLSLCMQDISTSHDRWERYHELLLVSQDVWFYISEHISSTIKRTRSCLKCQW
jgi:hypothetical protein